MFSSKALLPKLRSLSVSEASCNRVALLTPKVGRISVDFVSLQGSIPAAIVRFLTCTGLQYTAPRFLSYLID